VKCPVRRAENFRVNVCLETNTSRDMGNVREIFTADLLCGSIFKPYKQYINWIIMDFLVMQRERKVACADEGICGQMYSSIEECVDGWLSQ
jgi:hypothetical protein